MKKICEEIVSVGDKVITVKVCKIDKKDKLISFSRVYVVVCNKKSEVALIYNSKRGIWGFPGGHPNEGESIEEVASRECIEEIGYSISECEPVYVLINKLDGNKEELQVICFAKIKEKNDSLKDENESVTNVKFVALSKVLNEMGNASLWREIIKGFGEWQGKSN